MDVALGIVYFLLAGHGIAQPSQAAGDGDGEGRDFSFFRSSPVMLT
jgi:hypothetical protein